MRVAFLTNQTTRVNLPLLQQLATSRNATLVHVFFYDTVSAGRRSWRSTLRQFGLRGCLSKGGRVLLSRLRLELGRRLGTRFIAPRSAYEWVIMQRFPHSLESTMNRHTVAQKLTELQVDVLLVCVCKNILGSRLLSTPGIRFINVHPSLLPSYRGPAPTFWTLYHGEKETGVTFHEMTPVIDQGPSVAQYIMPLDRNSSEYEIESRLFQLAAEHIEEVLTRLQLGEQPSPSLDTIPESYYSYPSSQDRRELQRRLATVTDGEP